MGEFFEIDFLDVEAGKSGDAICVRYGKNEQTYIHVVDGGYQQTGEAVVAHIKKYYDNPTYIDHVVATHQDGAHAGGLAKVLDEFVVGKLWMLRPWLYARELLGRFSRFSTEEGLRKALREAYPNLVALENIAHRKSIEIAEPFQGNHIGHFVVMGPTKARYLDLIVSSEKTPEVIKAAGQIVADAAGYFTEALQKALNKAGWGVEYFPLGGTSNENEMSVTQFALINGITIMLTGDTGRDGLQEIIDFAPRIGLALPGVGCFQCPHHGGRHNVSSELLDKILGSKLENKPTSFKFTAVISAAKADPDHPRKSVVRALWHRGAKVVTTESRNRLVHSGAITDRGWQPGQAAPYPDEQEEWD